MQENCTLLIVDDQPEVLKLYSEFLTPKESGPSRKSSRRLFGTGPIDSSFTDKYRLLLAQSGEEAIKLLAHELKNGRRVAGGFFDLKLGAGMDGLATIHTVMAMDKELHGVVVTAYQIPSLEEMGQITGDELQGRWDCMHKPFTQCEIVQKARQMVSSWNLKRYADVLVQKAHRAERLQILEYVSSGIAHEFANLMLKILARADMAREEQNQALLRRHLDLIFKSSEMAATLVRNFQEVSRLNSSFKGTSLSEALDEAISIISYALVKNSLKIKKDYQGLVSLEIDKGAFIQIFASILINLLNTVPKGADLYIRLGPAQGQTGKNCLLSTLSAPAGKMPVEIVDHIFDADFSLREENVGWLSLFSSRRRVEAFGGHIEVHSDEGKGVEFILSVPISKDGIK